MATLMARVEDEGYLQLRWTPEALEEAIRLGSLNPERHYEILDGALYEKMGQGWPHAFAIDALLLVFRNLDPNSFYVSSQTPMRTGGDLPEPDLKVLRGSFRDRRETPSAADALLVVEVSDTTLATDLRVKAPIYAAAEIPVFWVVDLKRRRVEVHSRPEAGVYVETRIFEGDDDLPAAFEGCPAVVVSGLFVEVEAERSSEI